MEGLVLGAVLNARYGVEEEASVDSAALVVRTGLVFASEVAQE